MSAEDLLFFAAHISLVHLNPSSELVAVWPHHGAPQLMQPYPGSLIAAQTQCPLQAQSAGSVLLAGHIPHGAEPQHQRFVSILENSARRQRCLVATLPALKQSARMAPGFVTATFGTAEAIRPTQVKQVPAAVLVCGKPRFKFRQIARIVFQASNTTDCGYRSQMDTQTLPPADPSEARTLFDPVRLPSI